MTKRRADGGRRCFACGRNVGRNPAMADTRDAQTVEVGRECYKLIKRAGERGYQPERGGPRLWTIQAEGKAMACKPCQDHYGDNGRCDEGKPVASPHGRAPMTSRQPIYCTWTANGSKTHTPGSFRRGRVTEAQGWVNAAVGELARVEVAAPDAPASKQQEAELIIYPGEGTETVIAPTGVIRITKRAPAADSDPDQATE